MSVLQNANSFKERVLEIFIQLWGIFNLLLEFISSNILRRKVQCHFFRQKTHARKNAINRFAYNNWLQLYLDWLDSSNVHRADVFGWDISYRSYKSHKINAQSILFFYKMRVKEILWTFKHMKIFTPNYKQFKVFN